LEKLKKKEKKRKKEERRGRGLLKGASYPCVVLRIGLLVNFYFAVCSFKEIAISNNNNN
jgi:hypothetical protein